MDGLRAVAVLGVVGYHLGLAWLPGGFLGVDVFFVLSGFLITTLAIEEIERTGRLSLRNFYLRRARRLLPGLFLLLAVVSLFALVVLPEELAELRRDVVAALLYVANWSSVLGDQSYFEAVGRPPLLQHLWSLAVEEQFYLVWPVVVVAAMAIGRHRVRRVALLAALGSTLWMAVLAWRAGYPVPNDPSRAYFGTDTHAMGLLLGAALATFWAPWRIWPTDRSWLTSTRPMQQRAGTAMIDVVGVLALGVLLWTFTAVDEFSPMLYRGGFLAIAACTVLLVAALTHPAGVLGRVLAVQPLRYLGERSYGIYLWHWPLALITRPGFELPFGGWVSVLLRLGIVVAAAELSYRYVELPIRDGALGRLAKRVRRPGPEPGPVRAKILGGAVVLTVGLTMTGVGLFTATASTGSDGAQVQPAPSLAGGASWLAAQPGQGCSARFPGAPDGGVSVFGDSVVYGAMYQLRAARVSVSAAEARTFADVLAAVSAAGGQGSLCETVVLHAGNNGPVDEDALNDLLADLSDRRVFVVNLHVPRSWETHNNEVLARAAATYPNATLLDWNALAASHQQWLYPDRIHLVAQAGREAYTTWLLRQVRS